MSEDFTIGDLQLEQLQDMVTKVSVDLRKAKNRKFEGSRVQDKGFYEIHVVTPMFGGSAEAGKINEKHPMRSSSIRGHLRFWWRATKGAQFKNEKELYERESEIFGNTNRPSSVKIWVDYDDIKNAVSDLQNLNPNYVLFPFRENQSSTKYVDNFSFRLHIDYADQSVRTEIEAALWAWINLGGIGARTRRGCGSLYCEYFSLKESDIHEGQVEKWFQDNMKKYGIELLEHDQVRDWPTLSTITIQEGKKNIQYAWKKVIETYKDFRRQANEGRIKIIKGREVHIPGRSHWPEADSIRKLTKMSKLDHKELLTISDDDNVIAFPRAQFGLPIQFKFNNKFDRKDGFYNREPFTTKLAPDGKDRLASPVITKAIPISKTQAYGAIIVLRQPKIEQLTLEIIDEEAKEQEYRELVNLNREIQELVIREQQIYTSIPTYKKPKKPNENKDKNPMRNKGQSYESAIEAFLNSEEVRKWKSGKNTKNPSKH